LPDPLLQGLSVSACVTILPQIVRLSSRRATNQRNRGGWLSPCAVRALPDSSEEAPSETLLFTVDLAAGGTLRGNASRSIRQSMRPVSSRVASALMCALLQLCGSQSTDYGFCAPPVRDNQPRPGTAPRGSSSFPMSMHCPVLGKSQLSAPLSRDGDATRKFRAPPRNSAKCRFLASGRDFFLLRVRPERRRPKDHFLRQAPRLGASRQGIPCSWVARDGLESRAALARPTRILRSCTAVGRFTTSGPRRFRYADLR